MLCFDTPKIIDPAQQLTLTWRELLDIRTCINSGPPEVEQESINPKDAIGKLKPSIADIPATALVEASIVHALGHKKYGYYNWRTVPKVQAMVYLNAAMRHLISFIDGESTDPESRVTHLAHVIACCNILIDAEHCGNLHDDRPPIAPTANLIRVLTEIKDERA
jgi:hypothetical protein